MCLIKGLVHSTHINQANTNNVKLSPTLARDLTPTTYYFYCIAKLVLKFSKADFQATSGDSVRLPISPWWRHEHNSTSAQRLRRAHHNIKTQFETKKAMSKKSQNKWTAWPVHWYFWWEMSGPWRLCGWKALLQLASLHCDLISRAAVDAVWTNICVLYSERREQEYCDCGLARKAAARQPFVFEKAQGSRLFTASTPRKGAGGVGWGS